MPDGGGLEVLRRIGPAPAPRFLALSVSDAAEDVIAVIRAGARGYVTKTISGADLDQLTPREREVLQHIARGYMYKEIAQRLGISAKTVEAHVSAVLRKLQLSSRHELSRWAAQRRMLD